MCLAPRSILAHATLALCLAALAGRAPAQTVVAYPQDTDASPLTNVIPIGHGVFGVVGFEESRYQLLIPATHLPTRPSTLTGLALPVSLIPATVDYQLLEITLSATTQTTLSTVFSANLPAPRRVFGHTGSWTWMADQWNEILFSQPFEHDGEQALVVEIRKEVRSSSSFTFGTGSTYAVGGIVPPTFALPGFVPVAVGTTGDAGSGAASRATATQDLPPVQVRLLTDTPTLALRSDPNTAGVMYAIGGTVEVALYGPTGSLYCAFVGGEFLSSRMTLPGVLGAIVIQPLGELGLRTIPAGGRDAITFQLPDESALVGLRLTLQAGVAPPGEWPPTWTNGCDFVVQPKS